MSRPTLATIWLDGCSGCHMSFLDMDERLLEVAQRADLVYSPLVDTKVYPEDVDIVLVEGAVSTNEDLERILLVRSRTKILVALGENGVKNVEDLAGCATDDLTGWTERKDGESKHEPGFLDGLDVSREDAEAIIMQARLKAGWVTEAELAPPPAPEAEAAPADAAEPQA